MKLIIIGDGEFAEIACEYFTHDSPYDVAGFAVERQFRKHDTLYDLPVIDLEEIENHYPAADYHVFVAITYTQLNRVRARIYQNLKERGYQCANYISSRAFVWRNVILGDNVFIFENNVVQPFVTIGNNVVLWSGNHIGHRTVIHDHCFISSHVVISGYCEVGEYTFMGVNSTVADFTKIERDNFIGLGTVIAKNTAPDKIYKGNPVEESKISAKRFLKVRDDSL